ncbi:hypothetical protein, partial [Streptomyces kurssanovii]
IAYAENPPKKYQDIYPIAFDADMKGLVRETVPYRHALSVAADSLHKQMNDGRGACAYWAWTRG